MQGNRVISSACKTNIQHLSISKRGPSQLSARFSTNIWGVWYVPRNQMLSTELCGVAQFLKVPWYQPNFTAVGHFWSCANITSVVVCNITNDEGCILCHVCQEWKLSTLPTKHSEDSCLTTALRKLGTCHRLFNTALRQQSCRRIGKIGLVVQSFQTFSHFLYLCAVWNFQPI